MFFRILTFIFFLPFTLCAQQKYLKINTISTPIGFSLKYDASHNDSVSVWKELRLVQDKLRSDGYIAASFDRVTSAKDTVYADLYIGELLLSGGFEAPDIDNQLLRKAGYYRELQPGKPFSPGEYLAFADKVVTYLENNGYPFAYLRLDSVKLTETNITGTLTLEKGPEIKFDTIQIYGDSRVKEKFLMSQLHIVSGKPYSQKTIRDIPQKIRQMPYLQMNKKPIVQFLKDKAVIHIYLQERKSNEIDGMVGFLPGENEDSKLLITGELHLNLKNIFGTGKIISAEWQKYDKNSQLLDLSYLHPKLFRTPLDVKGSFHLLKQDTSFLSMDRNLQLSLGLGGGSIFLSAGYETSRSLSVPANKEFTEIGDYSIANYGLGYYLETLDDIFWPMSGWEFSANFSAGNKSIIENSNINPEFYQGRDMKSLQFEVQGQVRRFVRISNRFTFMLKAEGARIFNDEKNLFLNDLYRIGGLNTLRGFNERQFFASGYGLGTAELRFFTDKTSFLQIFYDQGYIMNQFNETVPEDFPFGFGIGLSFATKPGVFSFAWSLGKSESQPLLFNLSKIHFGLISRF